MRFMFIGLLCATTALLSSTVGAQTPTTPQTTQTQLPGYLLVVGKTTDRAKIGGYAASLPPIYASNNAYYLAIGGAGRGVTWLEGPWQDRSIIFGKFPSRAGVDAFWWGDAYRAAIRKRDNAGVFSVVALQSSVATPFEGLGTGYLIVMTASRDTSPTQIALSERAAVSLEAGVVSNGGVMLTSNRAGDFTSMEGDTVFDRFTIAAWPTLAAREAYLASPAAHRAAQLRQRLGLSVVASANGVPKTQAPPAATASTAPAQ
jgi:uncharacterized protein (DUF1330 family)